MTTARAKFALIAVLISGLALPAGAQTRPEPRPEAEQHAEGRDQRRAPLTFGLAGPYLAARMAAVQSDFRAAARYYAQAVAHDPGAPHLQDNALLALISAGEMEPAVKLAEKVEAEGRETELAGLLHRAAMIHREDWAGLLALSDEGQPESGNLLLEGLLRAWALLGNGKAQDALVAFEELANLPGVGPMVNYQLALARATVGDYEGAEALLADPRSGGHVMGFIARAQVLTQLERRDEAARMIDAIPGVQAEPQLLALRDRISSGQPVAFDAVRSPAEGVAQVFLTFATALATSPDPEPLALVHGRLAAWLAPDLPEARLIVAQLLQERQQFDLTEPEFEALRRMGQMRPVAELARIDALSRASRRDEAEKAALSLTATYPDLAQAWIALGDLMRQQEKFTQAVPAYDKALTLLADAPGEARWFPLYARGIALERSDQFDRAEKDLLAAIEIRPDSASLLNYLGYSWIDRNQNLDQALEMIKKAVELSPGDGYILDSLAWAYYRLGRYDDAVAPMEEAVGTMSQDPLVNDHLGDIYWKVGRHREAEVQWRRALSLDPTDTNDVDPERIRAKLDRGLDAVLATEAGQGSASGPAPQPQVEASGD